MSPGILDLLHQLYDNDGGDLIGLAPQILRELFDRKLVYINADVLEEFNAGKSIKLTDKGAMISIIARQKEKEASNVE